MSVESNPPEYVSSIASDLSDVDALEKELVGLIDQQQKRAQREAEVRRELGAARDQITKRALSLGLDPGPTQGHRDLFVRFLVDLRLQITGTP